MIFKIRAFFGIVYMGLRILIMLGGSLITIIAGYWVIANFFELDIF